MSTLDDQSLDTIFRTARTPRKFLADPIPESTLRAVFDVMKFGATSGNCWPLRVVLVVSEEAKAKLADIVMGGNRERVLTAGATAIFGHDLDFFERMDKLWPHDDSMPKMFAKDAELAKTTAFRNGSLQAAYFMVAARALGLDCGPMSGFDNDACDEAFFPGGRVRSNFICVLGKGSEEGMHSRLPRPEFDEVCQIV